MIKEDVINIIKQDILMNILDEDNYDFVIQDIKNSDILVGENSLEIDSVDLLEILVSIQKKFGFKVKDVAVNFFKKNMKTLDTLADFVLLSRSA